MSNDNITGLPWQYAEVPYSENAPRRYYVKGYSGEIIADSIKSRDDAQLLASAGVLAEALRSVKLSVELIGNQPELLRTINRALYQAYGR